ncbi:MAG: nucleotidyltransferase domain-containing protein [Methanobrevibacter sp.]|nr:nucleotidyltransferase domain-containing protein [Candidatus Methanovirga meridionalis]
MNINNEKGNSINRKKIAMDFTSSLDFPEIKKIILFGSVARNEDRDESDIDIFILTTDEDRISDKLYYKVAEVIIALEELISLKIVTLEEYETIKSTPFITTIMEEGIVLG